MPHPETPNVSAIDALTKTMREDTLLVFLIRVVLREVRIQDLQDERSRTTQ